MSLVFIIWLIYLFLNIKCTFSQCLYGILIYLEWLFIIYIYDVEGQHLM